MRMSLFTGSTAAAMISFSVARQPVSRAAPPRVIVRTDRFPHHREPEGISDDGEARNRAVLEANHCSPRGRVKARAG